MLGFIAGMAGILSVDMNTAAGIGFLLLIPLTLLALVFVPQGIYLAVVLKKDRALLLLSILTVFWIGFAIAGGGPAILRSAISVMYGCLALVFVGFWFVRGRRRPTPILSE